MTDFPAVVFRDHLSIANTAQSRKRKVIAAGRLVKQSRLCLCFVTAGLRFATRGIMKKRPDEHGGDALDGDRRGGRRRPAINDGVEASQRRSPHLLIVGVDDLIAGLLKQRLSLQGYEVNAVDSLGALRAMTPESESDIVLVASELAAIPSS